MKSFSLCVFLYLSTVALLSRSNEVPTLVISENELKEEINKENQYETQIIDTIVSIDSSADFVDNNTLEVVGDTSATTIPLPHIFVLNLDRATERWENIQKVMNAADLSIERLPGVDGRRLSPQELTKHSSFLARTFQPRGVVGCYISHRKFWQMIVDRNLDSAILFEDDVQLVPDFKQLLQTRLLQLKEDKLTYDVIFLGAIGMVHPQKRDSFFSRLFALYMGGCRKFCKVNDYLYQPTKPAVSIYYNMGESLNM